MNKTFSDYKHWGMFMSKLKFLFIVISFNTAYMCAFRTMVQAYYMKCDKTMCSKLVHTQGSI